MNYPGAALGLIETVGMTPAFYGMDAMLKAANVSLLAYENIGSTLVMAMVVGDVAAVQAAVEAGAAAARSIGTLTAHNVMPRPLAAIKKIAALYAIGDESPLNKHPQAMGLVETFGIVFALEAADAMGKAAAVEIVGFENVASGYISILVQGDVAACQAAVNAGVCAVEQMNAEVYSSVVIANPHPELFRVAQRYFFDHLC